MRHKILGKTLKRFFFLFLALLKFDTFLQHMITLGMEINVAPIYFKKPSPPGQILYYKMFVILKMLLSIIGY